MALEAVDALEGWEFESEAAEGRAPKKPSSQPSFRSRPTPGTPQYVTQAQLEASLARSDGKIKTVADGVSSISARLTALSSSLKKEADERKKSGEGQNKDLNQKLQMLALLPMLVQTPAIAKGTAVVDAGGNSLVPLAAPDPNSTMDSLLPLLMVSGLGGSGGGMGLGGDSGAGGDGGMMMLALVLAMSNRPAGS